MTKRKKILVIRFNSIGDIVLTTPVIQLLAQAGYDVHYLLKAPFKEILNNNPAVNTIWTIEQDVKEVLPQLAEEDFDIIVDLHNNLRSRQVKQGLNARSYTLRKKRLTAFMLTQTPFKSIQFTHIVERFIDTVRPIVDVPSRFLPVQLYVDDQNLPAELEQKTYEVIVIGAAFTTKTIPVSKWDELIISNPSKTYVLIGGPQEKETAEALSYHNHTINLVGQSSIMGSAKIIAHATKVYSGDTGMMHIAAALDVPLVAIYGSTHPRLGYTPYTDNGNPTIVINQDINCSPCTKQGRDRCPKNHLKCLMDLDLTQY